MLMAIDQQLQKSLKSDITDYHIAWERIRITIPNFVPKYLVVSITAKFGCDRCRSFDNIDNMKLKIFGVWGYEMPIYAPRMSILGDMWPAKWGATSTKRQKGTSLQGRRPYGTGGTCPPNISEGGTSMVMSPQYFTSGSAMAEGPRDVLLSRNSATTKYRYRVALFAWSYV